MKGASGLEKSRKEDMRVFQIVLDKEIPLALLTIFCCFRRKIEGISGAVDGDKAEDQKKLEEKKIFRKVHLSRVKIYQGLIFIITWHRSANKK